MSPNTEVKDAAAKKKIICVFQKLGSSSGDSFLEPERKDKRE